MKVLILLAILGALAGVLAAPKAKAPLENRTYVVACSHLPNHDKREGAGPMDMSDPFLVIRNKLGDQIFRSPTQDNTLDPVFQFSLNFDAGEVYHIEVRDEDSFNPDDSLGSILIPAAGLEGIHNLANPSGGTIQIIKLGSK